MSIYRSEKMMLYHIAMSKESAYEVLSELGDLGIVQFQDQNPHESHYTRPFSRQIKRCEDIEANIQLIIQQSKLYGVEISPQKNMNEYLDNIKRKLENRGKAHHTYLDQIEEEIEIKAQQLSENIQNLEKFKIQINQLHEYKAVLNQFKTTLAENIYGRQGLSYSQDEENNEGILTDSALKINFLAGIIDTADLLRFKRMVFRSTRGNCFIESSDVQAYQYSASQQEQSLDDPKTEQLKEAIAKPKTKSSFIIIFSGGQTNAIQNKIIRIADSFQASRYALPSDPSQYMKKMMQIEEQILEQQNTMNMTERNIAKMVSQWAEPQADQDGAKFEQQQCSSIEYYRLFVKREKLLYTNMNLLHIKNEIYEGHYWAPELLANNIDKAIRALHNRRINLPQTTITPKDFKDQTPPTYFQTNEFTGVFQQIVDTYGIARYQEINPGIFCVSMFPLKFGVMFGDIGHGGLLLIVGILLTKYSDVLKSNGLEAFAEVRYLILLMGICAFYCGFIYNDFFAIPWKLFGTCFENVEGTAEAVQIPGCVHPLGLDPKWYVAKNELTFMNSFKMKMAVIIGVIQMGWGVILKGCNHIHAREWIEFIFEFIPQIIFLTVTFGYMDFLIFYKWASDFTGENSANAPSIISQMINLPLKLGSTDGYPLWETESQENLQYWLLMVSLICVPLMLFPKPFILLLKSKMQEKPHHDNTAELQQPLIEGQDQEGNLTKKLQTEIAKQGHGHGHGEEFEFGEVFVHQIIETIEFVLGCISNTASYLRLWALSLAHGQLSKVFFQKTIGGGVQSGDILAIFIGWFLFVNITLGVIMAMDLMECFLHALRLQWVEFQNKFYKADGYAFQPFSFIKTLKTADN